MSYNPWMRLMKYPGGKAGMTDLLLPLIPYGHAYVEPFGGAGGVLLNRRPSPVEVINDLDGCLAALYRVLRDDTLFPIFAEKVEMTLFGKISQNQACWTVARARSGEALHDIDKAWAIYVQQNQSVVASTHRTQGQWARSMVTSGGVASVIAGWDSLKGQLPSIHERLKNVQVDERDAIQVIEGWDSPDTVFYIDPPYVLDTRVERNMYAHEMEELEHVSLIRALNNAEGMVVVSGYHHPIYGLLEGFKPHTFEVLTSMTASQRNNEGWDRAPRPRGSRTEVVWINEQAETATREGRLF